MDIFVYAHDTTCENQLDNVSLAFNELNKCDFEKKRLVLVKYTALLFVIDFFYISPHAQTEDYILPLVVSTEDRPSNRSITV